MGESLFNNLVVQFSCVQCKKLNVTPLNKRAVMIQACIIITVTDLATCDFLQFQAHNSFSRKEVIHPHVLVRMPCYDLTPIISPTLGRRNGLRVLVTLMV